MLMDEKHVKYGDNYIIVGDWEPEMSYQTLVLVPPCGKTCEVFILDGFDYGGGIEWILKTDYDEMEKILESVDHPARFREYFLYKVYAIQRLGWFLGELRRKS